MSASGGQVLDQLSVNLETVKNDETIPKWTSVLIDSFKVLTNEIKYLGQLVNRVHELEQFKAISETVTSRLQEEIIKLKSKIDDQEQRSRNMCLLVHGIDEKDDEDTDDIVVKLVTDDLGVEISEYDIVRSHRLGPKRNIIKTRSTKNNTRPIIFRLAKWSTRYAIYSNKRKLKGSKISISENLTAQRYERYKAAIELYGKGNCWTSEGRILAKIDNKIQNVTDGDP